MYLLDTNVVSELRRSRPHGAVLAWLRSVVSADIRISSVTVGELQAGVELTRAGNPARAAEIESWIDQVVETFDVIPVDAAVFRRWARLMHRQSDELYEDAMIAATAMLHDATVVTRNVRDFGFWDVPVLDPFTWTPS